MIEPEITITHTPAEATIKNSLIVVSNRLPFVLKRNKTTNLLERHARLVYIVFTCFIQLLYSTKIYSKIQS